MRPLSFLLICLALLTQLACSSNAALQPVITTPASERLPALKTFTLSPRTTPETSAPEQDSTLQELLISALQQRGYQPADAGAITVHYSLQEDTQPLEIKVDTPAPAPLGPYQALHTLQDVSGLLQVQLHDDTEHQLWAGQVAIGLSPEKSRRSQLEQAIQTLIRDLPHASP